MPKKKHEVHSRPPLARMMRTHQLIQNGEYPTCPALAKEFEISTRTAKRDVDYMKVGLNLPIEYDRKRGGFYDTQPVENFPTLAVTEAEVFALFVAHKAIAQYHGTPFQPPLETAFRTLTGQLDQSAKFTLSNPSLELPDVRKDMGLPSLEEELGRAPDLRLIEQLYKPAWPHQPLPKLEDEYNVHRIRVGDVVVRYVEDIHAVQMTVEGELPPLAIEGLTSDLRAKLSFLENSPFDVKPL